MKYSDKQVMFLVRGLPGSGKTTVAEYLSSCAFAADDFFVNEKGVYNYDPSGVSAAHVYCQNKCAQFLKACTIFTAKMDRPVAIHNTFSERWEMQPYFDIAKDFDYTPVVVDLFDGGLTDEELVKRNIHGVGLETITAMRKRWEHDWKLGNPTPPWERKLARR